MNEAMLYETFVIPVDVPNIGGLTLKEQYGDNFDLGKDEIWPYPPSEQDFAGTQE
jgi:hypothetical protein